MSSNCSCLILSGVISVAVFPSGACHLALPGSPVGVCRGEDDPQREAAAQEPPSCASRQDPGHAEVAAALRLPEHASGTPPSSQLEVRVCR